MPRRKSPTSPAHFTIMLLIRSSNKLWDEVLLFQPTHFSILTYGVQRTILAHSTLFTSALTNKKTRLLICPNGGVVSPSLQFKTSDSCHTKFIISHRGKEAEYYLTSMNLEIGLWENFLYKIEDKTQQKQILTHFNTKWETAYEPEDLPTFDHLLNK